ncbi:hypothetical protein [Companilactobacillus mishanensis]|uniref:Uncharacterized protein n=1 Tax=Companilactobacillus mishanensis TaxID=2486008 RepID=A0A5P0ZK08_9LACO|nr:hypothetical protein [Companilactobacillus mishanensis]MQS53017.1 hypothetical protein [Companilactobacillus mishanensis]
MHKHIKLIVSLAVIFVAVVFGIVYTAYNSYQDTNISPSENNSKKDAAKADTSSKPYKKKASAKSDENIFFQDKQNPDRVLAIHPFGSKGVYEFRKQANGNLYPEHKFFDGTVSKDKNGNITVTPDNGEKSARSISVSKDKTANNSYSDTDSGTNYDLMSNVTGSNDKNVKLADSISNSTEGKKDNVSVSNHRGEPEHNANSNEQIADEPAWNVDMGTGELYLSTTGEAGTAESIKKHQQDANGSELP